jgi:hypothetical protein
MKLFFLILLAGILSFNTAAQTGATAEPDSLSLISDTVPDTNEAGGINAAEADADSDKPDEGNKNWLYAMLGGLAAGVIATAAIVKLTGKKVAAAPGPVTEAIAEETDKGSAGRTTAAEAKKLKQEIKGLSAQVASLQAANESLEKNLSIYRNFDSSYFGEAFRKLIVPMNEALESGSQKEIAEHLFRIMAHFSSLSRYKIAKKQPYDETNIHYLLNQKGTNEATATEINADTPVDKTPKNIKAITDMLKAHGSQGLDDSIIAGYKIKNL